MEELLDESSREELLEQLMEEVATASSLRGLLAADGGTKKTSMDVACDMITAQLNIALYLKACKNKLEKQVESYKGLELSYHTEIEALSKQLEGLKSTSEDKDREIECLKQTISDLTEKLQESEEARSNMSLSLMTVESKLSDKDAEIEKLKAEKNSLSIELEKTHSDWQELYTKEGQYELELNYYKQQTKKADETISSLREELDSLKSQQQQTAEQQTDTGKTRVVYTKEQKDRMAEVYKQTFRNKTKTIEILHQEGIDVSYRHLIRILQKRGFKSEKKK